MNEEKQRLRNRINHEWEEMTGSVAWNFCTDLYEERDLKDLLYSKFLDDVENAAEEELDFLLQTMEDMKKKKA